jgi:hypothetical protein
MSEPTEERGLEASAALDTEQASAEDRVGLVGATLDRASSYEPPRAPPKPSDHRTIETEPVKLAPEIDPRCQPTQRIEVRRQWQRAAAPAATARLWLLPLGVAAAIVAALTYFIVAPGSRAEAESPPAGQVRAPASGAGADAPRRPARPDVSAPQPPSAGASREPVPGPSTAREPAARAEVTSPHAELSSVRQASPLPAAPAARREAPSGKPDSVNGDTRSDRQVWLE